MIHPKAYLSNRRNVKAGLISRSKILKLIDNRPKTIRELAEKSELKYSLVGYHMRILYNEKVVKPQSENRPRLWKTTGYGQQSL